MKPNPKNPFPARQALALSLLVCVVSFESASATVVGLTPGQINGLNTASTSFTHPGITLTPILGSTPATFNANAFRLGMDEPGTNAGAFNDPDTNPNNGNEEKLQFQFGPAAGFTKMSWDYSRADGPGPNSGVIISGFAANPGASLTGGVGASTISYDAGTLTIKLSGTDYGDPDGFLNLSNPSASAGKTLLLSVTDEDQAGAQLAIRGISYEDAIPPVAPVITTGLANTMPIADTTITLSVAVDPTTFPSPSYLWEFDSGGGFATVSTDETYPFTAGTATDGAYRVTVTNVGGSVSSTGTVASVTDADGINNQWEITYFGDYLLYGDVDVEPDGLTNSQEFAAGTDPTKADTDGDGLLDGQEAANNANPLVADTDGDGYSDGHEVNVSLTAANDPASTPAVSSGRNSIGITFASNRGGNPGVNLGPLALAGAPTYVQKNWNSSAVLGDVGIIDQTSIANPVAGSLVNNSGVAVPGLSFASTAYSTWSSKFNPQQPVGGLLSGFLYITSDVPLGIFDITGVPYPRYDLVVYLVSPDGAAAARGTIREETSMREYTFTPPALIPSDVDPVWVRSADGSTNTTGSAENFPRATHVIFRGLTSPNPQLSLNYIAGNIGIAAVQVVEEPDTDGDGMGNFYETSVGLNPADNGSINPLQAPAASLDSDTLSNIFEYNNGTSPTLADSDGDGLSDKVETDSGAFASATDTGSDPRMADTDKDGISDGVESNSGSYAGPTNSGTNPVVDDRMLDSDADGFANAYEVLTTLTDPFSPAVPGRPNPEGFAIAFDATVGVGNGPNVLFGPNVFAGVTAVAQKNWNRTVDLGISAVAASGDITRIATPVSGNIVNSMGTVIGDGSTGVSLNFVAGAGCYSFVPETNTPFGHLYNSFIFGDQANPDSKVILSNIPYATYDVYAYFGSEANNRIGTVSSIAGGKTYSFKTGLYPAGINPIGVNYVETTDTGTGNPVANYAVFRNQTASSFDVTTTVGAGQNTLGLFGVQVVKSTGTSYASWASVNAGNQAANQDFDGDGVANGVEYFMGATDSTFTPNPALVGGSITWPKNPATQATYAVQTSTAMAAEGQPGGWTDATVGVVDNGSSVVFTPPTGAPKQFTRLKVIVP